MFDNGNSGPSSGRSIPKSQRGMNNKEVQMFIMQSNMMKGIDYDEDFDADDEDDGDMGFL